MSTRGTGPQRARAARRRRPKRPKWSAAAQTAAAVLAILLPLSAIVAWNAYADRHGWLANMKPLVVRGKGNGQGNKAKRGRAGESGVAFRGRGCAELGEFSVRTYDPVTGTTRLAEFQLEGITSCQDEESFHRFMEQNNRCFREQVSVVIRNTRAVDLKDTDLLGRKIVVRVNRIFEHPVLESVQIKDFAVYEAIENYGFSRVLPAEPDTL
jgi:hypothetical protein